MLWSLYSCCALAMQPMLPEMFSPWCRQASACLRGVSFCRSMCVWEMFGSCWLWPTSPFDVLDVHRFAQPLMHSLAAVWPTRFLGTQRYSWAHGGVRLAKTKTNNPTSGLGIPTDSLEGWEMHSCLSGSEFVCVVRGTFGVCWQFRSFWTSPVNSAKSLTVFQKYQLTIWFKIIVFWNPERFSVNITKYPNRLRFWTKAVTSNTEMAITIRKQHDYYWNQIQ